MDVGLTEDQQLLVDIAARLAASIACPSPASLPWTGPGDSSYAPLVETGFVGMHVGEASGGGGAHSSARPVSSSTLNTSSQGSPGKMPVGAEVCGRRGAVRRRLLPH